MEFSIPSLSKNIEYLLDDEGDEGDEKLKRRRFVGVGKHNESNLSLFSYLEDDELK